ncbi:MAG: hypothetical protein ABI234_10910 [Ktedonobacteraceae bacterium]
MDGLQGHLTNHPLSHCQGFGTAFEQSLFHQFLRAYRGRAETLRTR